MSTHSKPHAWYALRRTLPTWSFAQNLKELVEYLPKYGVDELIVKVDTEEFTHGQPLLPWIQAYLPRLQQIKQEMDLLGILFSINPWITVGHNDRGRDARKDLPGLQTMVGDDGAVCTNCACPISPVWRENTRKVWQLYAETRPHIIWMEDDLRTFNHRPVEFSCFCPLHLARFAARVGQPVSRTELVQAILQPGTPHPWRQEYLDLQAEVMIETVAFLAKSVHEISPATSFGLMSSGPRVHALEGRRWREFAAVMADGQPFYSRPPMGNYSESSLRGFYYSHDSIKLTRYVLPADTIEQTEVENVPFTRYSKSVIFTFIEMAISFAYGSHGVTLNLFDHAGTPMESEPEFGRLLRERKPFLDVLAQRAQESGHYRGVQLLHHERSGYVKRLQPGAGYPKLMEDGEVLMQALESHGIATTYEASPVIAATGQQLRAFSDAEIRRFLSRGLLVDAGAAGVLFERGFGAEIGLASWQPPEFLDRLGAFAAEEFFNPAFGGAEKKFLTLTIPNLGGRPDFSILEPVPAAQIISRIVDPDATRQHVGAYAFENKLGGRVVVLALDLATAYGVAFNHPFRLEQLQQMVRWLGHGNVALLVRGGVYPLTFRKDLAGVTLLGLFNLALDAWENVTFELSDSRKIRQIEKLTPDGRWVAATDVSSERTETTFLIKAEQAVPFSQPLFLSIYWEN